MMVYDGKADRMVETETFLEGSEKMSAIASQWGFTYEETLENIKVRGECKARLVAESLRRGDQRMIGARWVSTANARYWSLVEAGMSGHELLTAWTKWLKGDG